MSTQRLSSVQNFNTDNIIFSEAKESNIPGSYRINISTKYENGTVGPLLFSTDNVYSFGVQENKSLDKPIRTTGYSIPLCLWNKDGPTEYQTQFIDTIDKVSEFIKKYMLRSDVKKSVKKYDLVESDLRKFNPLWYKKEDGEIVEGRGPMLYPKLMCDKKLKVYTLFADQYGRDLDPMTLVAEKCIVRACIKIESIFIGSKISLQIKVMEVEVQQQGNRRQRLLCKDNPGEEDIYQNDEQEYAGDTELIPSDNEGKNIQDFNDISAMQQQTYKEEIIQVKEENKPIIPKVKSKRLK